MTRSQNRHSTAGRALCARAAAGVGLLWLVLLLLCIRLGQLQIADGAFFRQRALDQQLVSRELSAPRGRVYDRNGRLLATSVRRYSIYGDPGSIEGADRTAVELARVLAVPSGTLARKLRRDCRFVWVRRQVTDELARRVRSLRLPGVHMQRESKRVYPQGRLAAHVVGFTDIDGRGLAGIEAKMDDVLRGRPGMERVLCDANRRVFRSALDRVEKAAFNGLDVHLTIDAYIQGIAEEELARAAEEHRPDRGAAVVLDARDGSVLALASWPTFDPQAPTRNPVGHQRNAAIGDAYEFGSVMKPFSAALALDCGAVTPETTFDCQQGVWRIGSRTLRDVHPYGVLSLRDVVCRSSNIGMAQVNLLMDPAALHGGLQRFGFGGPTGIALVGEAGGIIRPLAMWSQYSVVSVAFGYELTATPLGVARAFTAFANGGRLLHPRVIQAVTRPGDDTPVYAASGPFWAGGAVSPRTADEMLAILRSVVSDGTGARAELSEYAVAGKTGTAQLLREDGRGYSQDRHLGSFVALAPVPGPRIVVLVSLRAPTQGGYYGGTVAAPVVRDIVQRTLRHMGVPAASPGRGSSTEGQHEGQERDTVEEPSAGA
jgi:cell division protein FtsI (penicillin-binding protein 3)